MTGLSHLSPEDISRRIAALKSDHAAAAHMMARAGAEFDRITVELAALSAEMQRRDNETDCQHPAWEQYRRSRKWTDCGEWLLNLEKNA